MYRGIHKLVVLICIHPDDWFRWLVLCTRGSRFRADFVSRYDDPHELPENANDEIPSRGSVFARSGHIPWMGKSRAIPEQAPAGSSTATP